MCGLVKVVGDWIRELYRGISFQVSTISILLSKLQIVHGRSYRSQINRLLSDQQSTFTKMHLEWLVRIFYTELFLKQKIETAFPSYPKDVTFRPHKKGDLKCTRTFDGCLKKQPPFFFCTESRLYMRLLTSAYLKRYLWSTLFLYEQEQTVQNRWYRFSGGVNICREKAIINFLPNVGCDRYTVEKDSKRILRVFLLDLSIFLSIWFVFFGLFGWNVSLKRPWQFRS